MNTARFGLFAFLRVCASIAILGLGLFGSQLASAQGQPLRITIDQGNVDPLPISILDFSGFSGVGADMAQVIREDLLNTGVFRIARNEAIAPHAPSFDAVPVFAQVRIASDVKALVTGEASPTGDGRMAVKFRLWDVVSQQQIAGFQYTGDQSAWRRMAHRTADAVYERLTGEPGYFETRIVFVDEQGPKNRRQKRLAVMDYDGANLEYLTGGASLVLTPRFSPRSQEVTYVSYRDGLPRVYLLDVETRRQEILGRFPGMTFAPRFSPDGSKVLMSLARGGNTDIFEMDLRTRSMRRITNNSAIDTAPSYSPDGSRIVFESDRNGGTSQLYLMSAEGGRARRISLGNGRYSAPVWSPRGDLIAFTKASGGRFGIGVIRPDGEGERILTQSFLDESPTWAPNGRRLMFFRDEAGGAGRPSLFTIDIRGGQAERVRTPNPASDPAWGPVTR